MENIQTIIMSGKAFKNYIEIYCIQQDISSVTRFKRHHVKNGYINFKSLSIKLSPSNKTIILDNEWVRGVFACKHLELNIPKNFKLHWIGDNSRFDVAISF